MEAQRTVRAEKTLEPGVIGEGRRKREEENKGEEEARGSRRLEERLRREIEVMF